MSLKLYFFKKRLEAETFALQYIKNNLDRENGSKYKELLKQINEFLALYFNHPIFKVNNEEEFFDKYNSFKFDINSFDYDSKNINKEIFGIFLEIRYVTDKIKERINQS